MLELSTATDYQNDKCIYDALACLIWQTSEYSSEVIEYRK